MVLVAVRMLVVLTVLTGLIYPLVMTGISQVLFPHEAKGSLIVSAGRMEGSELIGAQFGDPKYFWSRLSATAPFPYNAASSAGSNYGPLNPDLKKAREGRRAALRAADPGNTAPIPVDLLTASGSGLDPHISPAAAAYQAARVAGARGVPLERVNGMIAQYTQGRQLGFLGEPRVNVVLLNRALDGK